MFKRPHHQRIARVLQALDGPLLQSHGCLFGGGTCIALRYGEYRESVDIDFIVSDVQGYRALRSMLTGPQGLVGVTKAGAIPLVQSREIRADQYGIRTQLLIDGLPLKFEVVLEGRIALDAPSSADTILGISTLTPLDMATTKLLANSDRQADDGVFSRDVIDLAMMQPKLALLRAAMAKAEAAYGPSVSRDLANAISNLQRREGWLERCMQAMLIYMPKALLWQKISVLRRVIAAPTK
jgi:Nucleotidyl transferase AbiEii toxin, Type IV TA system